jgi:hypothetical protein
MVRGEGGLTQCTYGEWDAEPCARLKEAEEVECGEDGEDPNRCDGGWEGDVVAVEICGSFAHVDLK